MQITFTLNHKKVTAEIAADTVLLDLVRSLGCKSVKRGCETANCGLCTVFLDEKPVLSCSVLAARVNGRSVTTLEGLQEEATPRSFPWRRSTSTSPETSTPWGWPTTSSPR